VERGVEQARSPRSSSLRCTTRSVNVRILAVEGLAYLATDDVIEPLLDIFHDDPRR
jgi:hypothetical protein